MARFLNNKKEGGPFLFFFISVGPTKAPDESLKIKTKRKIFLSVETSRRACIGVPMQNKTSSPIRAKEIL